MSDPQADISATFSVTGLHQDKRAGMELLALVVAPAPSTRLRPCLKKSSGLVATLHDFKSNLLKATRIEPQRCVRFQECSLSRAERKSAPSGRRGQAWHGNVGLSEVGASLRRREECLRSRGPTSNSRKS